MGKRSDLEPRAIELYAEGKEIPQISGELGVSENSLRDWKKRAGTEWDEARALFRKGQVASFEDVGRRVQRAREFTARVTGDPRNQGRMGLVLNEALQTMVLDLMNQMQTCDLDPDKMDASIDQLNRLAATLQRTEQAANLNMKREEEIRKQERERAAETAATIAKQGGMSAERVEEIKNRILGVNL